jgi:glycosyltransferase involved in cell wall biosynthesis
MNILFTSSWFPSKEHETLGNFVERHAVASALYHDVFVLYVRSSNQNEDFTIEVSEENGLKKVVVFYKKVETKGLRLLKIWRFYKGMKLGLKKLDEEFGLKQIDVCHHNIHFEAGIIPLYLKRKFGTPYIISENWTGFLPSNRSQYIGIFRKWLTKRIGNKADVQVPVSLDLKKSLESLNISKGRVEIVPNVVEVSQFTLNGKPDTQNGFKFIHISTLDEAHKNISGILRTFKKFNKEQTESLLTIIGDGDSALAHQLVKEFSLESKVTIHGRMESKEIAEMLKSHHIFLLFSNYENLPCVIVESLASGTPVLASTAGGTPEHLTPNLGELVSPKDEESLLEKMKFMTNHYNKYNHEELREYAVSHFSYEVVGQQFSDIYHSLV